MKAASGPGGPPRRWRGRVEALLVTAVAVILMAAAAPVATPSAVAGTGPTSAPPTYSGLELVHGTFFGWVPIARRHPDLILPETPAADTDANRQLVADLIDSATLTFPELLDRFRRAMYSGDRDLIRSETLALSEELWSAAAGVPNNTGGGIEGLLISFTNGKPQAVRVDGARFEQWIDRVVAILG
jgi:hypothetical protein